MLKASNPPLRELKYKKKAKVSKSDTNLTRISIDVEADDPNTATREDDVRMFISQAIRRFNLAAEAEFYNRTEGLKDVRMVDGDGQWDDDVRGRRERKRRPCLTINRFIPMISHVANEQRMSRPSIQLAAVGDGSDPEGAQVRQGIIRHIEVESGAETVYDNSFEKMIEKGWSWLRVVTDWESPLSHHQVIKIEGVSNDFSVYSDPSAEQPTRKDMKWAFIVYDMPRGLYVTEHPGSRACGLTDFRSVGDNGNDWITSDSIRVAEYYYIEEERAWSVRLTNGDGVWQDQIEERAGLYYSKVQLDAMDAGTIEPEEVLPVPVDLDDDGELIRRQSSRPKVKWAKINAVEILDGNSGKDFAKNSAGREVAGKYIPLVMICGRERVVDGKRRLAGMVRNNRDAQRMYNYSVSAFVEMIALAPKSPFVAAAGQIEAYKKIWDSANDENWPFLPYDPVTIKDQLVAAPQRQNIEPPVGAIIQAIREFDNDLKIGFNIFDPTLGAPRSDQSGRAVASLQARSDAANMNWLDNMRRAQIYTGEIILEMIPFIYDASRIITIIRGDKTQQVLINQEFAGPDGKVKNYDMAIGKYSVTVSLGEFASKREQAVQTLSEVAKNVPQTALPLLPLILENMDAPLAKEAAAIVRRMLPANMQEPGSPEQIQAQFQQLLQQHKMLVAALQRSNEIIKTKQLDNSTKEYIAGLQAQAQIVAAGMKAGNAQSMAQAQLEFQRIQQLLDQSHDRIMAEREQAHGLAMELVQQAQPAAPAGAQPTPQPQPQPEGASA